MALAAPTVALYDPAPQAVHADALVAPVISPYDPAAQGVQLDAHKPLYVPATHEEQEDAPVALNVPAEQERHSPGGNANEPAGQVVAVNGHPLPPAIE